MPSFDAGLRPVLCHRIGLLDHLGRHFLRGWLGKESVSGIDAERLRLQARSDVVATKPDDELCAARCLPRAETRLLCCRLPNTLRTPVIRHVPV